MDLTPVWVSDLMHRSKRIERFSWARLWAALRLEWHCLRHSHQAAVVTEGLAYYCGCSDCDYCPEPSNVP